MNSQIKTKSRENTSLWALKTGTGLFIVIFMIIHLIINHLVTPEGLLYYEEVIHYYKIGFVPFMECIFLLLVISHSLTGIRGILLDLNLKPKLQKYLDRFMIAMGVISAVYGIWLLFVIAQQSAAV